MPHPTAARLTALRARMEATGCDLIAIAPGAHMDWVLGFHPHPDERPCLLLITPASEGFLMPALNAEGTREQTDLRFFPWADEVGPEAALAQALTTLSNAPVSRVALDETMRADFALLLLGALPGATQTFLSETLGYLRMRKDAAECEALRRNAASCDIAMQAAFAAIRPGMAETDLARIVREAFSAQGADPAFWIVGSGPNGAFPHHAAGPRLLAPGDAVVIDIGGRLDGYPSDMTRMAVLGEPPEGFAEVHAVVDAAVRAALAAARPGVPARAVDAAARGVIEAAGYGPYFVHRTGHGLGIEIHEPPYITATNELILDEGMVFSIEPGIYLPGRFGVRLEEIVILQAEGPEVLSHLPRSAHFAPA